MTDPEFQELVRKQSQDIKYWWKNKFNYSSNDPRYLEATENQIFRDFIEYQVELYRKDPDKAAKEFETTIENTPDYDKKLREQAKLLPTELLEFLNDG